MLRERPVDSSRWLGEKNPPIGVHHADVGPEGGGRARIFGQWTFGQWTTGQYGHLGSEGHLGSADIWAVRNQKVPGHLGSDPDF